MPAGCRSGNIATRLASALRVNESVSHSTVAGAAGGRVKRKWLLSLALVDPAVAERPARYARSGAGTSPYTWPAARL